MILSLKVHFFRTGAVLNSRMLRDRFARWELSRRGFLVAGAAGIVCARGMGATPGCTLAPEQEEGPYYIDDEKLRRDITEGKPGVPLTLRVALLNAKTCAPLANAALDIWHCDALGIYSGFTAASLDGPGGPGRGGPGRGGPGMPPPGGSDGFRPGGMPPRARVVDQTRFLRGVQVTDERGLVEFRTLYPGWYSGRAIHIHTKVHLGGHVSHTGQLFFPPEVTGDVARLEPYRRRLNVERTTEAEDHVYNEQHGRATVLSLSRIERRSDAGGFVGTVTLGVDPEATPAPAGFGPGGGGRPFRRS